MANVAENVDYYTLLGLMVDLGDTFQLDWWKSLEYQGFDPEKTFRAIVKIAAAKGKTQKALLKDVMQTLIVYIRRGTKFNTAKFAQRSKADVADKVKALMAEYGILESLGQDVGPDKISVSRIAIVFAEIVSALYNVNLGTPIFSVTGLPKVFSFPAAPSIMTDKEWLEYKDKYLEWSVGFTKLISKGAVKKVVDGKSTADTVDDDVIKTQQLQYALNGRNSAWSIKMRDQKRAIANAQSQAFMTFLDGTPEGKTILGDRAQVYRYA